jgi:hypothetical protein
MAEKDLGLSHCGSELQVAEGLVEQNDFDLLFR